MHKLVITSILALGISRISTAEIIWYGGDVPPSFHSMHDAYVNSADVARSVTFENFDWTSPHPLNGIFGHYACSFIPTQAYYEIRSGVSNGVGGTLVSSGSIAVSAVEEGTLGPQKMYLVTGQVGAVNLTQGSRYFVQMGIDSGGSFARPKILETFGANGVGTPFQDHRIYADSPPFTKYQSRIGDLSYGLYTSVPEPASFAILGLGLLAIRKRLHRG